MGGCGRIDPVGVAEDGPTPDLIFFYLGQPCGGDRPSLREDLIVDAPSSCCFAEERHLIPFYKSVFDVDSVVGIGAEEVLPAELHLFST